MAANAVQASGKSKPAKPPIKTKKNTASKDKFGGLNKDLLKSMLDLMIKSRVLEERLIKIYKTGEAFFWIGAPGEEAFGVPLGMLTRTGQGLDYDYLHLHYRGTPTLIAMGMNPEDSIRLIMNKEGDVCTGGRNFCNHYCFPEMNVTPVSSPIEIQYGLSLGTARAQKRHGKGSVSIVTGGDAGTAEGDFASCLVWASRPGNELPILMTVQNNGWGISTDYESQHGEDKISDRGKAFGIRSLTINGNDPVESYIKLKESFDYIRKEQKSVLLEAYVSRLFGHSSGTGANFIPGQIDPVTEFQERMLKNSMIKEKEIKEIKDGYSSEFQAMFKKIQSEKGPSASTIWDHTFVNNENADWRKF